MPQLHPTIRYSALVSVHPYVHPLASHLRMSLYYNVHVTLDRMPQHCPLFSDAH